MIQRVPESARVGLLAAIVAASTLVDHTFAGENTRWVSVKEVYANGQHNAWPDLTRWRGKYYLVFPAHARGHGNAHGLVMLVSADGEEWETILDVPHTYWQIEEDETWPAETIFFLPTKTRLYVVFWTSARGNMEVSSEKKAALKKEWLSLGGSEKSWERWVVQHEQSYRTRITYTEDGRTFQTPRELFEPSWWLWRPQTFQGRHYMVGFRSTAQEWEISDELKPMIPVADELPLGPKRGLGTELFRSASLFVSDDGLDWRKHCHIASNDDGEPAINFSPDGRCLVVSRNGAGGKHAIVYVSDPPYKQWKTLQLDASIHQAAVLHHKNRWIVGGRYIDEKTFEPNRFDPENRLQARNGTRLWFLDDKTGALTEATTLPSWGDCGQPAILPTPEGDLLVAYYSCSQMIDRNLEVGSGPHPGKLSPTSIYLARVVID